MDQDKYLSTRDLALVEFLWAGGICWTKWRMNDLQDEKFSYHNTRAVREAVSNYRQARPGIATIGELIQSAA